MPVWQACISLGLRIALSEQVNSQMARHCQSYCCSYPGQVMCKGDWEGCRHHLGVETPILMENVILFYQ